MSDEDVFKAYFENPDKYVIKVRRGKAILVDKQILRWRKRRKKAQARAEKELEALDKLSTDWQKESDRLAEVTVDELRKRMSKVFGGG